MCATGSIDPTSLRKTSRSRTTTLILRSTGRCRRRRCRPATPGPEAGPSCSGTCRNPLQGLVENTSVAKCFQMWQPSELIGEVISGEPGRDVFLVKLSGTIGYRPLRLETQLLAECRKIHTVRTGIAPRLTGDQQLGAGNHVDHRLCDLSDGEIVRLGADIVSRAMHFADRCFQREEESSGDVPGVHKRSPRRAVREHANVAGEDRVA